MHGGKTSYDKLKEIYKNPPGPACVSGVIILRLDASQLTLTLLSIFYSIKIACMTALTRSTDPALIDATLEMVKTKGEVRAISRFSTFPLHG